MRLSCEDYRRESWCERKTVGRILFQEQIEKKLSLKLVCLNSEKCHNKKNIYDRVNYIRVWRASKNKHHGWGRKQGTLEL